MIKEKKYELVDTGFTSNGYDKTYKIFRIKALKNFTLISGEEVRKGDFGGCVLCDETCEQVIDAEEMKNFKGGKIPVKDYPVLSHEGKCWINSPSIVGPNCHVSGNAIVDNSILCDNCKISDNAIVYKSQICPADREQVSISDDAQVLECVIFGNVGVKDDAMLSQSTVEGNLEMFDRAQIVKCDVFTEYGDVLFAGHCEQIYNKNIEGRGEIKNAVKFKKILLEA